MAYTDAYNAAYDRSPSSRRAWIEMYLQSSCPFRCARSPSSRRAWIEISVLHPFGVACAVALHAEGVDRNIGRAGIDGSRMRRPPRGGRG